MKDKIRDTAMTMAIDVGLNNITRSELCAKAGVPDGAFTYIMGESFSDFIVKLATESDAPMSDTVTRERVHPELRHLQLLNAAIEVARSEGYEKVTFSRVAKQVDVSPALVIHYFKSTEQLRNAVMRMAVRREILELIAQGLTRRDPIAIQAPADLKASAAEYIAGL